MKIKSILTGCLTLAAMAACLIPMLAQEPDGEAVRDDDYGKNSPAGFAQREAADLYAAAQGTAAPQANGYRAGIRGQSGNYYGHNPLNSQQAPLAGLPGPGIATTRTVFGHSAFDPKLAQAINESNAEVGKLIKQLKETEADSDKEPIKEKIKAELDLQYDAYLDHHEKPLKQLEERLAKLRKEFEARKQAKNDLVKLRLDTIWYDSLGLGWPSNRTTTSNFNNAVPWRVPGAYYPANGAPPSIQTAIPAPPNPPTPPPVPTQPGR